MAVDYRFLDAFLVPPLHNRTRMQKIFQQYNITKEVVDEFRNYTHHHPVNSETLVEEYCSDGSLLEFRQAYYPYHGYVTIAVCVIGILTNILNVLILQRKEMVSSTNNILTALAFADGLVMLEYIPFSVYMYVLHYLPRERKYTYGWAMFVLFHANFTQVCHTISIGLNVLLAAWRYLTVVETRVNIPSDRQSNSAWLYILLVCIASPILCLPFYLTFQIQTIEFGYVVHYSTMAKTHPLLLKAMSFWIYSVIIKLIPCIILTLLTRALIGTLSHTAEHSERLRRQSPIYNYEASHASTNGANKDTEPPSRFPDNTLKVTEASKDTFAPLPIPKSTSKSAVHAKRTTKMLVVILVLFLLTEFPQGILGLLSGVLQSGFFDNCYQNFSEVMDLVALVNGCINFLLYCCMSSQFRESFVSMFRKIFQRRRHVAPPVMVSAATTRV